MTALSAFRTAIAAAFALGMEPSIGQPYLLKDINQTNIGIDGRSPSSMPEGFMEWRGDVYFSATKSLPYSGQLWRTDGSEAGTTRLLLNEKARNPVIMGPAGDWLLFHAEGDVAHGRELWRTDGTAEGTMLLKDMEPGAAGSFSWPEGTDPDRAVATGGMLYFFVGNSSSDRQLWRSDGTTGGTEPVTTFDSPGGLSSLVVVGGDPLFFRSRFPEGATERETTLWKIPTEAGEPVKVATFPSGRFKPTYVERVTAVADRELFFVYNSNDTGSELWRSDGTTEGTRLVKDIRPQGSSNPDYLMMAGSTLFFCSNDGVAGTELWKSDGTPEGTVMVKDINPRVGSGSDLKLFGAVGNTLFFAVDGSSGDQLWTSDGTTEGTVPILAELPRHQSISRGATLDDLLVFSVSDQIWTSEGTAAGTRLIGSGPEGEFQRAGGFVFWAGRTDETGAEPWRSNGTPEGTGMLMDIAQSSGNSDPWLVGKLGSGLLISANDGITGQELWWSDGTSQGTQLLSDIRPGSNASEPGAITILGDVGVFSARASRGRSLWRTDGTHEGTYALSEFASIAGPRYLQVAGSTLYFTQQGWPEGVELWATDGTVPGTRLLLDIRPGPDSSSPTFLTMLGESLFFSADDGTHGRELWISDGEGIRMVRDINRGAGASSEPYGLCAVGSTLFFAAKDGASGFELWKSDGTAVGTVLVKNLHGGAGSSSPGQLVAAGERLYFTADDGVNGRELWTSDGTAASTEMVANINPSASLHGEYPKSLTVAGDKVYFVANDEVHGFEWWSSDGTAAGTRMLKDLSPWPLDGATDQIVVVGDRVVFAAATEANGTELWISDGTPEGTMILPEVMPGPGNSYVGFLSVVDETIYFRAIDEDHGMELWALSLRDEAEFEFSAAEGRLNRQTGLYDQDLTIRNTGGQPALATRVLISGLEQGVTVRNATGVTEEGVPYIDFIKEIVADGGTEILRIEYFKPLRGAEPDPEFEVIGVRLQSQATTEEETFIIDRVESLEDGSLLLEFTSVPGRSYRVQYSADTMEWTDSPSPVVAVANRTQWIDAGPPKTSSSPAGADGRFYRVAELTESDSE